jgi:hypothetical protein
MLNFYRGEISEFIRSPSIPFLSPRTYMRQMKTPKLRLSYLKTKDGSSQLLEKKPLWDSQFGSSDQALRVSAISRTTKVSF